MDSRIETVVDARRGCGVRDKRGSVYLVGKVGESCGKLPIILGRPCIDPECRSIVYPYRDGDRTVKFSRAPRKIEDPGNLFD